MSWTSISDAIVRVFCCPALFAIFPRAGLTTPTIAIWPNAPAIRITICQSTGAAVAAHGPGSVCLFGAMLSVPGIAAAAAKLVKALLEDPVILGLEEERSIITCLPHPLPAPDRAIRRMVINVYCSNKVYVKFVLYIQ
jgi:hypothetical protein